MEFIFLGTGTSAGLPYIDCVTAPPDRTACKTCLSASTPKGRRNNRKNTSAVLQIDTKDGKKATIVIDAGKTFQASALEYFPKHGLREIDALLITHAHADALNGLDDLRSWTLYGLIQQHIDIYLSQDTFDAVKTSFPYLVSKVYATGGGDVPEFEWHIIQDLIPFEIKDTGIFVTPFPVHHGFCTSEKHLSPSPSLPLLEEAEEKTLDRRKPFISSGFKVSDQLVYISDVSHIPDDSWDVINPKLSGSVPVCVLDCLQLEPHPSHFNLAQAVEAARRIGAERTYLTGFCHAATHDEYVTMAEIIGGARKEKLVMATLNAKSSVSVEKGDPIWVRPAHDGLRVVVKDRHVWDETYLDQPPQGKSHMNCMSYFRDWFSWRRFITIF